MAYTRILNDFEIEHMSLQATVNVLRLQPEYIPLSDTQMLHLLIRLRAEMETTFTAIGRALCDVQNPLGYILNEIRIGSPMPQLGDGGILFFKTVQNEFVPVYLSHHMPIHDGRNLIYLPIRRNSLDPVWEGDIDDWPTTH